jgi:GNAT superfamily N-acetyltransferase
MSDAWEARPGQGGRVPWRFSADVRSYALRVRTLLAADPVSHTLALTVLDDGLAGRGLDCPVPPFGWFELAAGGAVVGAVSGMPSGELLLAEVPASTVPPLVRALREAAVSVPGAVGEPAAVDEFARLWTRTADRPVRPAVDGGGHRGRPDVTPGILRRLYQLAELRAPVLAAGSARRAGPADEVLVANWYAAFQRDAGTAPVDVEPVARDHVAHGLVWLWVDEAGEPAALACRSRMVAGMVRLGPVYTPPSRRRRGYGAAATWACTAAVLRSGAEAVVLLVDEDNTEANRLYQRLGYLPVRDHHMVRFAP